MFRFLFRFVGLWILAAGFIALVYDGTKSIAGNQILVTSLRDTWTVLRATSLDDLLRPALEQHVAHWLWDPVVSSILGAPTWVVLGLIGSVLILIGRKKKPLIGYGRD
jgi:hypothetical protein